MNKVTVIKNENYTTVSNIPLQCKDLSWKAKGLLMYLMTLPPSWEIRLSDLENRSTDGRDSTNAGLRELLEKRYLSRIEVRENGKFLGYDYTVSDTPDQPVSQSPERVSRNGSPVTGKPTLRSTQREEILNKEKYPQDSPPLVLAALLLTEHRKNDRNFLTAPGQEKTALQRWAADIDKILRLDHRTAEEVRAVIVWCQTPGCFWVPNILSGAKLREKFPTLLLQSSKDRPKQNDDSWRFVDPREERLKQEAGRAI